MPLIRKTLSIALYGTSEVEGRLNNGWPGRFEAAARALATCVGPLNVFNQGKGSQNSDWGLANVNLIADPRPDVAIIDAFDINDRALVGGVPEVTLANSLANKTAIVAALRAANPAMFIALMTMNDVNAAGGAGRPDLAAGYAQTVALAATLGTDIIDNFNGTAPWGTFGGGWPHPGPDVLYQIDPTTGMPDGLHVTAAAFDTYTMPNLIAYIGAKQAAFWP